MYHDESVGIGVVHSLLNPLGMCSPPEAVIYGVFSAKLLVLLLLLLLLCLSCSSFHGSVL